MLSQLWDFRELALSIWVWLPHLSVMVGPHDILNLCLLFSNLVDAFDSHLGFFVLVCLFLWVNNNPSILKFSYFGFLDIVLSRVSSFLLGHSC